MDYEERRRRKIEKYRQYAKNARKRSASYRSTGESISNFIPFGQPILVGHHSERKHRRDIERLNNFTRREIEEDKKAEYWGRKADAIENSPVISRHDPQAVIKLQEKLAGLEKGRGTMKAVNKLYAKGGWDALRQAGYSEKIIQEGIKTLTIWNGMYKQPFPPYSLQNLSSNIRRIKQRIESLKRHPLTPP